MEIEGFILQKSNEFIRLNVGVKQQVVDVFYTKVKLPQVENLVDNEIVTFSVILQSVEFGKEKLARCWLSEVIQPRKRMSTTNKKEQSSWADKRLNAE